MCGIGSESPCSRGRKVGFYLWLIWAIAHRCRTRILANAGPPSPTLKFFLKASGQNPDQVRGLLKQEMPMNPKTMDELLNLLPGEFVLFQAGQIFHTPTHLANVEALRSAVMLSLVDDRRISILEFLRNYPTREFYVDGQRLARTAGDVSGFLNGVEEKLQDFMQKNADVKALLCDCSEPVSSP
ncbi:MAG: alpha/beta hydrolase [Acaryochloridaceae cyanobacterium RL_2_7]|nr:alpha/beta hydrolase [Acaryochloridaceae cyanobacterium RL_2_7]